jgi:hypothetical protein
MKPKTRKAKIEAALIEFATAVTQPHESWHDLSQARCFKKAVRKLSTLCTEAKHLAYEEMYTAIIEMDDEEAEGFT